nr:MAG TPA: hypothetical protein [Caudoviricetes sp.]
MWRCSGAKRGVPPFFVAIPPLWFDSPHLHPTPRNLIEIPGFLLRLQRFPPAHCPGRMYQDVSGCTIDSGAGVAQAVEKDSAPLDMEEDT